MPFVSYAQNFEDVMLWRALGHVERGFYIDVGAQSADLDSVTRAFSERGWRGINIEPHPFYFAQLLERRPLDINLCTAVGNSVGTLTMNFVGATGLSTANDQIAAGHAAAGYALNRAEVGLTTLANLWDEHVPPDQAVHFLKVDVEGFEAAVLAGNDWLGKRPWIVVVEATLPNSQTESHGEWEGALLKVGYTHAYSDGLNRFYVAEEHRELGSAFKYPPNVFDDFVTAQLVESRERAALIEGELAGERARVALAEEALAESQQRAALTESELAGAWERAAFTEKALLESRQRIELAESSAIEARACDRRMRMEVNELRREIGARDVLIAEANRQAESVAAQYRDVLASSSWRVTAPLRKVASAIPRSALRYARRAAKAAWWVITPWRLPMRMRYLRDRSAEALHIKSVGEAGVPAMLDLTSDQALLDACGLSYDQVLWPTQSPQAIVDKWSAARFCIDILRVRADVRAQFPGALSDPSRSGFAQWLIEDHGSQLDLSERAKQELRNLLLREDIAASAPQMFLFRTDVRANLPHGLTPCGQGALFRWFMREGRRELDLKTEEILWLLMQAAENPALELVRAFLFTPEWQKIHPDGLTVFGRTAFSEWFAASYQVAPESWLEPSTWPVSISAARQLREAYHACDEWQKRHPRAFESAAAAISLITWLQSKEASLPGDARTWCAALDVQKVAEELASEGVNLIGHFCCPSGVRVSAEALVEGMNGLGIQTSLRDLRTDIKDEPNHVRFQGLEDFDVTIIHTQPEPFFSEAYARSDLQERSPRTYRIAYWYWEFDSVPESWIDYAASVDEVWAATEFVAKGLRERLSVPVKTLFPGVRLGAYTRRNREYFGIRDDTYAFLFNFHMNSVMERKNPLGLIRAFKRAFRADEPVSLVVKTMFGHHHPAQMDLLREAAIGSNVQIIDEVYDADEVLSLTDVCDAYVSLHRSEGLGLTMAEAMLMGKPVIATNYSGNVDFMNTSNSLLVPFELVKLGRQLPPYDADLMWAEPSIEHAAALMRRIVDEPVWARELGARAKVSAETALSVEAAARKVEQRLAEIRAQRISVPDERA
jgi:FkbM family methyltransferase